MKTTTEAAQTINLALDASIDDEVILIDADGVEFHFATHAALFQSDDYSFYVLQNGVTGEIVSDAYNSLHVAEDAAEMGLTVHEG